MSITDARFVELEDGRKILQLERSLWGGEGHEWFTPHIVKFDEINDQEQDSIYSALGEVPPWKQV